MLVATWIFPFHTQDNNLCMLMVHHQSHLIQTNNADWKYPETVFASAIPYGNDETKAHLFSPSPPPSPVCQI